ncbi:MAG: ABC transporter permease [Candidatus Promineifilaceae bacterium]
MLELIKLAWRNVWRNWRRTMIAVVAIVLSLALLIFAAALMDGIDNTVYGNMVRLYGGNVLIHAPGFRERASRLPMLPLTDAEAVLAVVNKQPNVLAASRRINTGGLLSNRDASHAVGITAVEPDVEGPVSLVAENIVAGRYLTADDGDSILIGQELADELNVTVGDRVSLLGRRKDESMRQRTMTIVGIFDLGLGEAEKSLLYMNLPVAQQLYNLRGQETEIAVILDEVGQERAFVQEVSPALPNYEVDALETLRPEFREAMATDRATVTVMATIMLTMAGIGILNLMLMAAFERTREMGVLAALGLKGRQTILLFVLEGAFIGLVGALIGCLLGWLLLAIVGQTGIDISYAAEAGEIYALMGDRMYPSTGLRTILSYGLIAIVVAVLASLIPAWQASRKEPAESLHYI